MADAPRYKPRNLWAVMQGDVLTLMLFNTRQEARRAVARMPDRLRIVGARVRIVRVTVQVHD